MDCQQMDCQQVVERLPWWLNRTLEPGEAQQVQDHLERCDACQEELRETQLAWAFHAGHLPAEVIVDHALGRFA